MGFICNGADGLAGDAVFGSVAKKIQIPANEQFAGKTYAEVVKMIEDLNANFIITEKTTASYKYQKDLVVSVDKAGEAVEEGTTITIYVSKGPGPSTQEPEEGEGDETGTGTGAGTDTGTNTP